MGETKYFQVIGCQYLNDPFRLNRIAGVAYEFTVLPNGDVSSIFKTKVFFPATTILICAGIQMLSGNPQLSQIERRLGEGQLLRYAFYRLKNQLEESNLANVKDLTIGQTEAETIKGGLVKQCDYIYPYNRKMYCIADENKPIETSSNLCCVLPEPLLRCDNLRVDNISAIMGSNNRRSIAVQCYCMKRNPVPSNLQGCSGFSGETLDCWNAFKFYLEPTKPPIGFRPPAK